MARHFLTLLLLLMLHTLAFSQVKIGVFGGPQLAGITEKNSLPGWDSTTGRFYTNKSGLHLGINADIPLAPGSHWSLMPAVMYTEKGRSFSRYRNTTISDTINGMDTVLNDRSTQTLSVHYIEIPVNLAYKFWLNKKKTSSFILSAGPYVSFFYNGKFSSSTNSNNSYINYNNIPFDTFQNSSNSSSSKTLEVGKKEDSYRTLGYGYNLRGGFEFGNVTLTGFMSRGLDNLYYAAYSSTFKHKVYGASLGIWLGRIKEEPVIRDKDGDGVVDGKDECPQQPGSPITAGCPDRDADGIADVKDKCPDVAGIQQYGGCPIPDTDGDGVNDEQDKCINIKGLPKYGGCPIPDTDMDGVNDEEDKCPAVAGTLKYGGCPVPDKDADGINDEEDKCPDVAGTKENNGCPAPVITEAVRQQVSFAADNIFFALNSAKLLDKSFAALDKVALLLVSDSSLQLLVEGHTDNTGTDAANKRISTRRAEAVRQYLISKGADPAKVRAEGFGAGRPVSDNKTAAGRAKNRRVELKLNP